ncbi:hypothetical protein BGX26_011389 [Mortierella sp. AD094]|nr:hypothetical protein BGX26_011389 [Mortierella sp. AD094]
MSTTSASSEARSPAALWTKPLLSPSSSLSASSITGSAAVEQPPLLISQPIMSMAVVPAAIMGIKSTSCISLGTGNSPTSASASLLPLVGRDYMSYSSLNGTLVTGKVTAESSPRPLSSMEYAEYQAPNTVARVSTDQQSIHPLELDPDHDTNTFQDRDHSFKESASASAPSGHGSQKELQPQPVIRKKTSFAARIRNVFIGKQNSSKSVETQEDIISLSSSGEDDKVTAHLNVNGELHRGSVSSSSSVDTALGHGELRRDSGQTVTPLTSPDTSPLGSPTVKSTPTLIAGTTIQQSSSESPSICPLSAQDAETETETGSDSSALLPKSQTATLPNNQTVIQPTPTRTVKKRLSFASISSFFGSRNPQERRAKQQRSSSLPHVENPLVVVGRQIAGFQRRHSLNDLHDSSAKTKSQSAHQLVGPPWKKGSTSIPASTSAPAVALPPTPTKKLSLNSVFNKQLKKKKNIPKSTPPAPTKPLKSALVHRPPASSPAKVHHVHATRRRSASVRSQGSSQRRQLQLQYRQSQHHPQRQSQNSHGSNDPFARLAEANQTLASLSMGSSDHDFCTSPQTHEAPAGGLYREDPHSPTRPPIDSANGTPVSCTLSTPPTPRVLPVATKNSKARSDSNYSPPLNPLATLSRSSSCCSFSSASEDVNASRSTSSVSDDGVSCSSTYSSQFEVNATSAYSQPRGQSASNDENSAVFHPILPASAARVSVDRIAVEAQMKLSAGIHMGDDMTMGNSSSTYESSTMSSSSTTASSTSSPGTAGYDNKSGNGVYNSQHGCIHQQSNYQHLKHQQQLMALEQQQFEDEYYTEDQNDQEQGLFVDADSQQSYQYQSYYYGDSSLYPPRPPRQLQFSKEEPTIHPTWTSEQYDRTSDINITASRLTPTSAQKIKLELNQFKSQEMEVHQDSRVYTHFFI